ncbi:MAG: tripartite tricarboxylate transporter substrate-binding protein [Deltaproteobacteria bacterium]|nr:tripartite tricarboxylate transporter substrate-binding protein [Deltaproteobacteria bacterium]
MKTFSVKGFLLVVMVATTLAAVSTSVAAPSASDAAAFYKGKTVTLYCSGNPGTTSDMWARAIARHLEKVIGTTVVVKNESAANGKVLFTQFAKTIKGDGLNICYTQAGTMTPPYMMGDKGALYEIAKFKYLGGMENANMIMSVKFNGPIKNVDDLRKTKGLKFAHQAKTSLPALANALAMDLLGLDGKMILGFEGSSGKQLAVLQGECHATVSAGDAAMVADSKKTMLAIMQIGKDRMPPGEDLPIVTEFAKANSLSDTQKRLLNSMDLIDDAKMLFVPADTPQDKVDFLANAFKKAYDTPELKADLQKFLGFKPGAYVGSKELTKRVSDISGKKSDVPLWNDLLDKYTK